MTGFSIAFLRENASGFILSEYPLLQNRELAGGREYLLMKTVKMKGVTGKFTDFLLQIKETADSQGNISGNWRDLPRSPGRSLSEWCCL